LRVWRVSHTKRTKWRIIPDYRRIIAGPCYCRRMQRTVDMILGLTAAVATALLLGLIARDDVGMSADMIRTDALSAAGIIFAAGCQRFSAEAEKVKPQHGARGLPHTYRGTCIRMCFTRSIGFSWCLMLKETGSHLHKLRCPVQRVKHAIVRTWQQCVYQSDRLGDGIWPLALLCSLRDLSANLASRCR
jgi:hypothetical protein